MTELAALDLPFQSSLLIQLDPAHNAGVVAIAWGYDDDGERMATLSRRRREAEQAAEGQEPQGAREQLPRRREPTARSTCKTATACSRCATARPCAGFPRARSPTRSSPTRPGERLVGIHRRAVTMYDAQGTVQWKQNVWGAQGDRVHDRQRRRHRPNERRPDRARPGDRRADRRGVRVRVRRHDEDAASRIRSTRSRCAKISGRELGRVRRRRCRARGIGCGSSTRAGRRDRPSRRRRPRSPMRGRAARRR